MLTFANDQETEGAAEANEKLFFFALVLVINI